MAMANYHMNAQPTMIQEVKGAAPKKEPRIELGRKKNVSVYGLQKFPVTLYAEQWLKLIEIAPDILRFIEENRGSLSFLDEEPIKND
jgi:hypothetical protein